MKTAMVWGASGGIGRALVKRLADEGWRVVALSRHVDDLDELDLPPKLLYAVEADPGSDFSVQQAMMNVGQEIDEPISLWIYSAGDILSSKVAEMSATEWQRILNANLTGAFLAAHNSFPLLTDDAHLFFLGAYSEKLRLPGLSAYAAAKAGLEAFGTALGKEERKRTVTVVRPGAVDTPLWEKMPMRLPKNAMQPDAIAERIMQAHKDSEKGMLDI